MTKDRIPCPSCRAKGEDSQGNHLRPFEDGKGGWCFKENRAIYFDGEQVDTQRKRWTPQENSGANEAQTLKVIGTYPVKAALDRKITADTYKRFGVRTSVDESTGEPEARYYPYFDDDGSITGVKKRALPKSFSVIGKVKGLFGKKACKQNARFVMVTEGEEDACAAWQMFQSRGKDYNVVSLPNGANEEGVLDKNVLRELEWLSAHETVCLCLDNDAPGKATATTLAETLASQCEVRVVTLPRKDAGKMLEDGLTNEFFDALRNAKTYRPESIVEGSQVSLDSLMTAEPPGIELPWPKLQKMTKGLRKGEITTLCAGSGIGKSTFAREVGYHVAANGYKVAIIGLETKMEDVARFFVAIDNNVPGWKLVFNPSLIPKEKYEASFNWMFKSNQVNFFKHWGSIDPDTLHNKMLYFAKALGVDFIVLDHCSMVVAGNESQNERKDLDVLFERMARVCVETGVGIIPIIHLKRVQGKSFNKGGEVELTDLRGSSGCEAMSFNVWAIERDQQGDNKDIANLRVLKNRSLGFTGKADSLLYNHDTGRLELLPENEGYE